MGDDKRKELVDPPAPPRKDDSNSKTLRFNDGLLYSVSSPAPANLGGDMSMRRASLEEELVLLVLLLLCWLRLLL